MTSDKQEYQLEQLEGRVESLEEDRRERSQECARESERGKGFAAQLVTIWQRLGEHGVFEMRITSIETRLSILGWVVAALATGIIALGVKVLGDYLSKGGRP